MSLTKTINGQTVELITNPSEVNKEVTFSFDVMDAKSEPYLGALAHVVITGEKGFNTQFDDRRIFKTEAAFKVDGEVRVFRLYSKFNKKVK